MATIEKIDRQISSTACFMRKDEVRNYHIKTLQKIIDTIFTAIPVYYNDHQWRIGNFSLLLALIRQGYSWNFKPDWMTQVVSSRIKDFAGSAKLIIFLQLKR